jgi:polygalacturonase
MNAYEYFPDGTLIDKWFYETDVPALSALGKQYILTDYGIFDDGKIYTQEIQRLIDTAAENGGGVIVVPQGTYRTGALFFKQGVHLYVARDGVLMGSDDISDYPLLETRIEGETCTYFSALINADGIDGFTMLGEGTVDGNGLKSWKAFWLRLKWNPKATNKDEQRPRLVYISNCQNVLVAELRLQNSHFWTNHIYKCRHVKFIGCEITSPITPVGAPSTDAIDIDVCTDVLVKNCKMSVNDDAIALKGGKGPYADTQSENGANERILIEDCVFGVCHSCLTCGSESIHNRNVVMRRIDVTSAYNVLRLKMRPDTPQLYEYLTVESVHGKKVINFLNINPWTQFYDLKGRKDIPISYAEHVKLLDCKCACKVYCNVKAAPEQYILSDFIFENMQIEAAKNGFTQELFKNVTVKNATVSIIEQ